MDFLEIRKKAKERADAKASSATGAATPAGHEAAPAGAPGEGGAAGAPPSPDPVVTEVDVLEGELAARLQGLPPPADERFTTWRPGAGRPPEVPAPVAVHAEPRDEDFALVALPGSPPAERAARVRSAHPEPPDPLDEFFYRPDERSERMPVIGAAAEEAAPSVEPLALEEYLTFRLGPEEYAVAIGNVREVLRAPPVTEVPRAPADVLGVVTVRGEVVPVFDPRRRLGLPPAADAESSRTRIVIVDAGEGPCGLLVDAVESVARIRPGSVEACPQGIAATTAESVAGIGRVGARMFMVLDLGPMLRRPGTAAPAGEGRPDAGA